MDIRKIFDNLPDEDEDDSPITRYRSERVQAPRELTLTKIRDEASDIRIHFGDQAKWVGRFERTDAADRVDVAVALGQKEVEINVDDVDGAVARGFLIKIGSLWTLKEIVMPPGWWEDLLPRIKNKTLTTYKKGKIGEDAVVNYYLGIGAQVRREHRQENQVAGTDLWIDGLRVQVKFDHRAGPVSRGGSGNVFIQTAECHLKNRPTNPFPGWDRDAEAAL